MCELNKYIVEPMENTFIESYSFIQRFNRNNLQNVIQFFAYLLFTDSISWEVLSVIRFDDKDIDVPRLKFTKGLFEELIKYMGYDQLSLRVIDP